VAGASKRQFWFANIRSRRRIGDVWFRMRNPSSANGTKRNCLGAHGISGAEGRPAVPSTWRRQPPLTRTGLSDVRFGSPLPSRPSERRWQRRNQSTTIWQHCGRSSCLQLPPRVQSASINIEQHPAPPTTARRRGHGRDRLEIPERRLGLHLHQPHPCSRRRLRCPYEVPSRVRRAVRITGRFDLARSRSQR